MSAVVKRAADQKLGCSTAPVGTRPVVRYRHSATISLRAKATMAMRRMRPLRSPTRSRNQRVSSLPGLMPHPEPAKLDCEGAGTAVAGLADALLAAALPPAVRWAGQAEVTAHPAPIGERAGEHLLNPLPAPQP